MNDRLRLIQYLYDEGEDRSAVRKRLANDKALRREYEQLRETKDLLDRRDSPSPEPDVVDRVVASARTAATQTKSETDRRPADDRPVRSPSLRRAGAALAVVLLVGVGWWAVPEGTDQLPEAREAQETASSPARAADANAQSMPAWDSRDEFVRIHRHLERLRTQSQGGVLETNSQVIDRP